MQTQTLNNDFKAVEFMRDIRTKLSEEYLQDQNKYWEHVKKAFESFKLKQIKKND